jgi:lysine 2,3-aminomutase
MDLEGAFAYLQKHPEVRDVLLSGGDPLLLSDSQLDAILTRLRQIPTIEFIRIGTRIPIFLPQRITTELLNVLKKHHPLWMSVHSNHPKELTQEVRLALGRLADAGIPLGNQSVLLKGVNDRADTLKSLFHKLLLCRVRPYYLYQCDLISGSAHLRTTIRDGQEIMEQLRGHTTGYAVPTYVVDGPGGGGKIPIGPNYIVGMADNRVILKNYKGDVYEYPEIGQTRIADLRG